MSEFHVEVGAYALDALDESERAAFEDHLAGCASCQCELAEFQETMTRLAAPGDVPPPPELRASLLDAIRAVRPLPPVASPTPHESVPHDPTPHDPTRVGPRRALEPSWDVEPELRRPVDELAQRRQRRRARWLTLAVAAVTVVALALVGWTYVLQREQQVAAARSAATSRLLSAPDMRTYAVTVDGTPAAFVVSKSLDEAMFVGADLPRATSGRTYQLWTVGTDATARPDITFAAGPDTPVFMTGDISDAIALAVSREPEGGSQRPTTTPVVAKL